MIKNYFKTAWRNLLKNRTHTFINISGLSVGIAVAILTGLWIWDELSFNKYHENYSRIGQIMTRGHDAKHGPYVNNSVQYPLATEIQTNYKDNFKHVIRASWVQDQILSVGDKVLSGKGQFMDTGAPEMLSLKMLKGNRNGLNDPHSIMISTSLAKSLFGNADPINQLVVMGNKTNLRVTGVFKDLPVNSQFNYVQFLSTWDLFVAENSWIKERATNDWRNHFIKLYAEIRPGTNFETVSNNIKAVQLQNIRKLENFKEDVARNPQLFIFQMGN